MSQIIDSLNGIIDIRYMKKERVKRVYGTIQSVTGEDTYRAAVLIDNIEVSLLNKSGEKLSVGDAVWVHYWTNISSGYIAVRIGAAENPNVERVIDHGVLDYQNLSDVEKVCDNINFFELQNIVDKKFRPTEKSVIYINEIPFIQYCGIRDVPTPITHNDTDSVSNKFKDFVLSKVDYGVPLLNIGGTIYKSEMSEITNIGGKWGTICRLMRKTSSSSSFQPVGADYNIYVDLENVSETKLMILYDNFSIRRDGDNGSINGFIYGDLIIVMFNKNGKLAGTDESEPLIYARSLNDLIYITKQDEVNYSIGLLSVSEKNPY